MHELLVSKVILLALIGAIKQSDLAITLFESAIFKILTGI